MLFTRSGSSSRALLTAIALTCAVSAAEAESFFKRGGEGYFWYEDPPPPIKLIEPPAPEPVDPATVTANPDEAEPKGIRPFSVAWLKENLPILLDRAIDSGKREDMEAFLYAQRLALDKAHNFTHLQRLVVNSDPILDENNRVPFDTFIRQAVLTDRRNRNDEAAKHLATMGGIVMFFDSSCIFCVQQFPLIVEMQKNLGFETRFISVDGKPLPGMTHNWIPDTGQFQTLNLKLTPTIVYAVPPDNFYILAQGAMSYTGLVDRLLVVAESEKLLSDEMIASINPSLRGVARWEDMLDGADDDPAVWVKLLKERLQGRY